MEEEIDLRQYVEVLIRSWGWIAGLALVAAAAALGVSFLIPPTYEATVVVPPEGAERRVRGIVVQRMSRQPLAGITVRVVSTEGEGAIDAVTTRRWQTS